MMWPLADWVKNLIEKKFPGLSDSGMASGGLSILNFLLDLLKISFVFSLPFPNFCYSEFFKMS